MTKPRDLTATFTDHLLIELAGGQRSLAGYLHAMGASMPEVIASAVASLGAGNPSAGWEWIIARRQDDPGIEDSLCRLVVTRVDALAPFLSDEQRADIVLSVRLALASMLEDRGGGSRDLDFVSATVETRLG